MPVIKNLQKMQKQYVMDSLYCTDYSEKSGEVDITDSLTDKGKLQYVASALKTEAFYENNIKRFGGNRPKIIADHLQGLPSYVKVPYENYEIVKQGKEWGYDLSTEAKEDKFCENWWINIGAKLTQLMEKHGVEIKKYSLDELDFNDGMKKVDESAENILNVLPDELRKKVGIVQHDNATYLYFNPELKEKINQALEPLLSEKSLENLVAKVDEFDGFNAKDLKFMGFKFEKAHRFVNEFQAEYSKELEDKMKSFGATKTFGHEGNSLSYAIFKADVKEHPDYGKTFISIYESPNATPKLATMDNILNELDELDNNIAFKKFKEDVVSLNGMNNRKIIDENKNKVLIEQNNDGYKDYYLYELKDNLINQVAHDDNLARIKETFDAFKDNSESKKVRRDR